MCRCEMSKIQCTCKRFFSKLVLVLGNVQDSFGTCAGTHNSFSSFTSSRTRVHIDTRVRCARTATWNAVC